MIHSGFEQSQEEVEAMAKANTRRRVAPGQTLLADDAQNAYCVAGLVEIAKSLIGLTHNANAN